MKNKDEIQTLAKEIESCRKTLTAPGDETRQHLIIQMMLAGDDCSGMRVPEITELTSLSRPAVSHHVQILKDAGIVRVRKEGTMNYYGTTTTSKLYENDTADRYFHIFYNPSKQAAEREKLEQKIDRLRQYLEQHIGSEAKFGDTYRDYFYLFYRGKKLVGVGVEERSYVIQKELNLCGYFCIITSEKMTASQALIQYKGRDISEKLFRADKSFLGCQSMRVQSAEALSTKIFLEFVALIVRSRIYTLLKETMLRLKNRSNYMTVPAALRELEKIEMVRHDQERYILDHAVTRKQKTILSAFGLDENDVRSRANEIGRILAEQQPAANNTMEGSQNGENEVDSND